MAHSVREVTQVVRNRLVERDVRDNRTVVTREDPVVCQGRPNAVCISSPVGSVSMFLPLKSQT